MGGSPPVGSLTTTLSLRCSSCGAPYANQNATELLTCIYCGTTQRVVDARQFLDHFTAQVTAFLRQAIPSGLDVMRSGSIDPVARLAAFNSSVRPHLTTESDQYRFALFNFLSSPLVVLPFLGSVIPEVGASPTAASVFVAKVESVTGLAVDDEGRDLVRRASGIASAYQCLLVAAGLAKGAAPERYHLIAQNLTSASTAIRTTSRWAPLVNRLSGLADQARAVDYLLSPTGLEAAHKHLEMANQALTQARDLLGAAPDLGYMTSAVEQEIASGRTLGAMLDVVETSPKVPPHPYAYLERLGGVLDWLSHTAPPDWATQFRSLKLREEVFAAAAQLRGAQAGRGSVRVLQTGSGVLVPFWIVELPYTFETGVLWTKRGKEVPETLLVAATFPADPSTLPTGGAARALTDVFSSARGGVQLNQIYSRLAGKEQKITDSGSLGPILRNAASSSLAGRQAIPPLTTGTAALRLLQNYIEAVRFANPKAASQLRASSPRIVDMVYIPCVLQGGPPLPWLGGLSPASVGDPRILLGFVA
jgi:DNA-directed RNA polymerase subunit RPC12/RpoP